MSASPSGPSLTALSPPALLVGSSDATIAITGTGLGAAGAPAVVTGTVDLTTLSFGGGGSLDGLALTLTLNGAAGALSVIFASPANVADVLTQANAIFGPTATATASNNGVSPSYLVVTTAIAGLGASISVGAGSANTTLGLTGAIAKGTPGMTALLQTSPTSAAVPLRTSYVASGSAPSLTAVVPASYLTPDRSLLISVGYTAPRSNTLELLVTGGSAGLISVSPDGSYAASPTLGPFGTPSQATSLAQAIFEAFFPSILGQVALATQAQVVDATTNPPTTTKGRVLTGLAAQNNAQASAIVGYLAPSYVAQVANDVLPGFGVQESAAFTFPTAVIVGSLTFVSNLSVGANGTDYATLTITRHRGSSSATIATAATSGTSWTAFRPVPLGGPVPVQAGDIWTTTVTKSGAGAQVGGGALQAFVQ